MKKWLKTFKCETSLAVQWLKTELPMQGVRAGSIPGRGTEIPCAVRYGQKKNSKHEADGDDNAPHCDRSLQACVCLVSANEHSRIVNFV